MKRICSILLAAAMVVTLTACGIFGESSRSETSPEIPDQASADQLLEETDGKVLIAYFTHEGNNVFNGELSDVDAITSASVQRDGDTFPPQIVDGEHKGNTQIIAEYVAEHTGGDLFAIQLADDEKYPVDGYETLDVAQEQRAEDARPALSSHVENIADYDVIYLGFPNWWGTMPMPVFTFLEEYDFSGKTIIPFATHDGSGLGSSRRDIEEECPDAVVLDGLEIRYNEVLDAQDEVNQWIDSMS